MARNEEREDASGSAEDYEEESSENDDDDDQVEQEDNTGSDSASRSEEEEEEEEDGDENPEEDTSSNKAEQRAAELKKQLAEMSFEEIMELKTSMGTKRFNRVLSGISQKEQERRASSGKKEFKRLNKNRPREMSSKRRVSALRQVVPRKSKVARDPRFDDLSGKLNQDGFNKAFGFLEDKTKEEIMAVKKKLKKTKNAEKREELMRTLQSLRDRKSHRENQTQQQKNRATRLKRERELIKKGKKPFFLKKSDEQKLDLIDKYKELDKQGRLAKALRSRRKHKAQKELRKLPNKRRALDE